VTAEFADQDFQRFWRRLQQLGLNAYEARCYLVLLGHPQFKALELAARAHVPRQKVYEILDSLVEKGFAQVVQEKTKLFSAVEPAMAIPSYILRRRQLMEHEIAEQSQTADGLIEELKNMYNEGQVGRGTLDYLRIVTDPAQTATEFRRMLMAARRDYLEFLRPPYAADPFHESLIVDTARRGLRCRFLVEAPTLLDDQRRTLTAYQEAGIQVRLAVSLPLKLALFDDTEGLIALLDPVISRPNWTAVVFTHTGMAEAMKALFEQRWAVAEELGPGPVGQPET
jgi:sugar-specific transcriptional regulator TrmB